jgi:hypothetical protein
LQNNHEYVRTLVRYPSSLVIWRRGLFLPDKNKGETMVAFVKISKKGKLVRIKEVEDTYRYKPYQWDDDE